MRQLPKALVLCLLGLVVYHAWATQRERAALPPPGRLVETRFGRLHIRCTGAGSPTVVLESGLGASSNIWALVQSAVETKTRVCSYDRVGYGWSARADRADEYDPPAALANLLHEAGEQSPFFMVGHSLGGEYARMYAQEHDGEVAGLVLVATAHPDTRDRDPAVAGVSAKPGISERVMPWLARAGVFRYWPEALLPELYGEYLTTLRRLPAAAADAEIAFLRHARYHDTVLGELTRLAAMEARSRAARSFGEMPLVVISERAASKIDDQLQTEMAAFSRRGRRVVLEGGHVLPVTQAQAVSGVILEMVAAIRAARPV